MLFFVIGCVKEKNCENATEGMLVTKKIDGGRFVPRFYPFYAESNYCMHITNKLPKEYVAEDSTAVRISFEEKPHSFFGIRTIEITCIERIQ